MRQSRDYLLLFFHREGLSFLGKRGVNLWFLVAVLTATFLAVAFSTASMRYLSIKMEDPFIRWVDIPNIQEGDFDRLQDALDNPETMAEYGYDSFQADYYEYWRFFGNEADASQFLRCRFFDDIKTNPVMTAIIDPANVVAGQCVTDLEGLDENSIGVFITGEALARLGYEKAPAYLDYAVKSEGADTLGFQVDREGYVRAPIPVLGVVKRLPSSMDIVSTRVFIEQDKSASYPFNLGAHRTYGETLCYFVPSTVSFDRFADDLRAQASAQTDVAVWLDDIAFYKPAINSFMPGRYLELRGEKETLSPIVTGAVDEAVSRRWRSSGVRRVFDYDFQPSRVEYKSYVSLYFSDLSRIRAFEDFVRRYGVKIDMTQIDSRDNYQSVRVMATILSWSIVVFAIFSILLFIINLLETHFQQVKRNLGTFKAFGIGNRDLILTYVAIFLSILVLATLLALLLAFLVQRGTEALGILKEGTYGYFQIASTKTLLAILIIFTAAAITVHSVMDHLLKKSPGDLVYDR